MKLNFARASALGTIGIAMLSAALTGGCAAGAGEPAPSSSEATGTSSQPVITPISLTTGAGCTAVGTFGIASPQIISFIAANTSNFQNAQFQLYTMDSQNKLTQVNQQTQTASASMMALLQASSSSSAAQEAKLAQSAANSSKASTDTNAFANENDTTTATGSQSAFSNSDITVLHHAESNASASGTASNSALNSSMASNNAFGNSGSSQQAMQNFLTNAFQSSVVPIGFFGGVVVAPSSTSSSASQNNSASALANAFFNNGSTAAQQAAAAQNSSFSTASHTDNTTLDQTDQSAKSGSAYSQTLAHSMYAQNGTSADQAASNLSSLSSDQASSASQEAKSSNLQNTTSSNSSNVQVYNDLQQLNSSKYVLVANLTANQANSMLQLFQGSNGVVTGNQSFPIDIPTCGGN